VAAIVAALWAIPGTGAFAADNGSVSANVTVATPCIIVTPSTIDFGTQGFSTASSTASSTRSVGYTNCSSASERVFGKGTDATGTGATWNLVTFNGCSDGANKYSLDALAPNSAGGDGTVAYLTTVDQQLETVQGATAGSVDNISLYMPCAGSSGAGLVMSFTITFTATF
jgi:hypothetical protein